MKKMHIIILAIVITGIVFLTHAPNIGAQEYQDSTIETPGGNKNMMLHTNEFNKRDTLKWINKRWHGPDTLHQVFDIRFLESEGDSERNFIFKPLPEDSAFPCEHIKEGHNGLQNAIDLNDPAIESFRKRKMKDGREKLVIIRKSTTG